MVAVQKSSIGETMPTLRNDKKNKSHHEEWLDQVAKNNMICAAQKQNYNCTPTTGVAVRILPL